METAEPKVCLTWDDVKEIIRKYIKKSIYVQNGKILPYYTLTLNSDCFFEVRYSFILRGASITQSIFDQTLILKLISLDEVLATIKPLLQDQISILEKDLDYIKQLCNNPIEKITEV